jgi:hypothetical protein
MSGYQKLGAVLLLIVAAFRSGIIEGFSFEKFSIPGINKVVLDGAYFVILEESSERPVFAAKLYQDTGLWAEAESIGVKRRWIDVDRLPADQRDRFRAEGLPVYRFVNGNETVISSGPLPETRDQVLKIIRQEG